MSRASSSVTVLFLLATGCGGGQDDAAPPAAGTSAGTGAAAETAAAGSHAMDAAGTTVAADTPNAAGTAGDAGAGRASTSNVAAAGARTGASTSGADSDASTGAATGTGAQDVEALLRQTARVYSDVRSMQAEFTMLTQNPLLGSRVESRGTLFQRRPDRILLRFAEPAGDIVLADGRHFWIYYPSVDPKQVIRSPATEGAAGGVDLQAQFVGDPVTRFRHTARGREDVNGRDAAVISLVPHEDLGYRQLDVWIDTQDYLARRFRITEHNGITRLIELRDVALNPVLADDLFRFVPPEGVRVVDRG